MHTDHCMSDTSDDECMSEFSVVSAGTEASSDVDVRARGAFVNRTPSVSDYVASDDPDSDSEVIDAGTSSAQWPGALNSFHYAL